jgi:hypothetical protein
MADSSDVLLVVLMAFWKVADLDELMVSLMVE